MKDISHSDQHSGSGFPIIERLCLRWQSTDIEEHVPKLCYTATSRAAAGQ